MVLNVMLHPNYNFFACFFFYNRALLWSAPLQTAATQTTIHPPTPVTICMARPDTHSPRPETHAARRTHRLTNTLWVVMYKLRAKAHTRSPGARAHTPRSGSYRENMFPQIVAAHTLRVLTHKLPGWWRRTSSQHLATMSGVNTSSSSLFSDSVLRCTFSVFYIQVIISSNWFWHLIWAPCGCLRSNED